MAKRSKEEIAKDKRIREERKIQREQAKLQREHAKLKRIKQKEDREKQRQLALEAKERNKEKRWEKNHALFLKSNLKMIKDFEKASNKLPFGRFFFSKKELVTFIIWQPESTSKCIVKFEDKTWRDGFWFYDFDTNKHLKFVKEKHKPKHGNDSIRWSDFDQYLNRRQ